MKKTLVLAIAAGMLLSLTGAAMAESYGWYFSQSGNDATGDGSTDNPWKTLSKAKTQINAADSSDTVNLYFKRGDTWTVNTLRKTVLHGFEISSRSHCNIGFSLVGIEHPRRLIPPVLFCTASHNPGYSVVRPAN